MQSPFKRPFAFTGDSDSWKRQLEGYDLIPLGDHVGSFGYKRANHIHEGIDIYVEEGTPVYPMLSGKVIQISDFTGEKAGSPWWNDTSCVIVECDVGYLLYGEILVDSNIEVGCFVGMDTILGTVKRVLKKDKGRPISMLHLEHYTVWPGTPWLGDSGENPPLYLQDPSNLFFSLLGKQIQRS